MNKDQYALCILFPDSRPQLRNFDFSIKENQQPLELVCFHMDDTKLLHFPKLKIHAGVAWLGGARILCYQHEEGFDWGFFLELSDQDFVTLAN